LLENNQYQYQCGASVKANIAEENASKLLMKKA